LSPQLPLHVKLLREKLLPHLPLHEAVQRELVELKARLQIAVSYGDMGVVQRLAAQIKAIEEPSSKDLGAANPKIYDDRKSVIFEATAVPPTLEAVVVQAMARDEGDGDEKDSNFTTCPCGRNCFDNCCGDSAR
jgi:hypothetical protein